MLESLWATRHVSCPSLHIVGGIVAKAAPRKNHMLDCRSSWGFLQQKLGYHVEWKIWNIWNIWKWNLELWTWNTTTCRRDAWKNPWKNPPCLVVRWKPCLFCLRCIMQCNLAPGDQNCRRHCRIPGSHISFTKFRTLERCWKVPMFTYLLKCRYIHKECIAKYW